MILNETQDFEHLAFKQRETYISTINHDLKIPALAQIRALELLINEKLGGLNEEQKEIIKLTLDSCRSMYEMLSVILSSYKFENGDIKLDFEIIELSKIFEECFSNFPKHMKEKHLKIQIESNNRLTSIFADRHLLAKAFKYIAENCFSNAEEYSQVKCETQNNGEKITVSVTFKNPYIRKEILEDMFNLYAASSLKFDTVGSSIKLYLAKQIIHAHKGTIFVEKDGAFNTYKIELPILYPELS